MKAILFAVVLAFSGGAMGAYASAGANCGKCCKDKVCQECCAEDCAACPGCK